MHVTIPLAGANRELHVRAVNIVSNLVLYAQSTIVVIREMAANINSHQINTQIIQLIIETERFNSESFSFRLENNEITMRKPSANLPLNYKREKQVVVSQENNEKYSF